MEIFGKLEKSFPGKTGKFIQQQREKGKDKG